MSIATLNHAGARRERATTTARPAFPTAIVVAGLVLGLFVAIAYLAQTAALLVPGVVFFVTFVAADLAGSRAYHQPARRAGAPAGR